MKQKTTLKLFTILTILLSFACKGELEDCVTTICDGPDGTDCREEPNYDSGCFVPPNNGVLESE